VGGAPAKDTAGGALGVRFFAARADGDGHLPCANYRADSGWRDDWASVTGLAYEVMQYQMGANP